MKPIEVSLDSTGYVYKKCIYVRLRLTDHSQTRASTDSQIAVRIPEYLLSNFSDRGPIYIYK